MEPRGYEKLNVWKKADELALQVYLVTKNFPKEELYGLTSQLRRASISIPTNIVEGCGRQGKKETRQFINIALGSLAETEYLIKFCKRINFITDAEYNKLMCLRDEVGALLWGFYKSFNHVTCVM